MKKFVYSLVFLFLYVNFLFSTKAFSQDSFDVRSGWNSLRSGMAYNISIPAAYRYYNSNANKNNIDNFMKSYYRDGSYKGCGVRYKTDPYTQYNYDSKNNLEGIDKIIMAQNFPLKSYNYDKNGNLTAAALILSKSEEYDFNLDGSIQAHHVNGYVYDAKGHQIGRETW